MAGRDRENERDRQNDVYFSVDEGMNWEVIEYPNGDVFSPRQSLRAVSFDGFIYAMGGLTDLAQGYAEAPTNEVWRTENGSSWDLVAGGNLSDTTDMWSPRFDSEVVVFQNSLTLVGGVTSDDGDETSIDDVWRSDNGIVWAQVFPLAGTPPAPESFPFGLRYISVVVVGNKLVATVSVFS
jgi:hypothetical protein